MFLKCGGRFRHSLESTGGIVCVEKVDICAFCAETRDFREKQVLTLDMYMRSELKNGV